jgi:hypothetical protein
VDFSALDRKEKVKEFRKRANQMQVFKEGRRADKAYQLARKMGKEKALQKQIDAPQMYRQIKTPHETALWAQVVEEMLSDPRANRMGARMAILEN